jgi:hypothetical protein
MDNFDQLTARHLDDLLSPTEQTELCGILERDAPKTRRLAETYAFHRRLEEHYRAPEPEVIEAILEEIARGEADFVQSVFAEVETERRQRDETILRRLAGVIRLFWCQTLMRYGLGVLAVGLFMGVLIWLFGAPVGQPRLVQVQDTGLSLERQGQAVPALEGTLLQSGDTLRLTGNRAASVGFAPENTRIAIEPGTSLTVVSLARGKHFLLQEGKLEVTAARQRPFRPMLITTPVSETRVVGTRFELTATTNKTRLDVAEGKVVFTRLKDLKAIGVTGGNYAVAAADFELLALPQTGKILREFWSGVSGKSLREFEQDPNFPARPQRHDFATSFSLDPIQTNSFLVRFRGYLHPPVTGDYEFWLAGATDAQLFMSPNGRPADRLMIAKNAGERDDFDQRKGWDDLELRGGGRWSPPIQLMAGKIYYMEALVWVRDGEGHLSVAWKGPGMSRELLAGEFLSPAEPTK